MARASRDRPVGRSTDGPMGRPTSAFGPGPGIIPHRRPMSPIAQGRRGNFGGIRPQARATCPRVRREGRRSADRDHTRPADRDAKAPTEIAHLPCWSSIKEKVSHVPSGTRRSRGRGKSTGFPAVRGRGRGDGGAALLTGSGATILLTGSTIEVLGLQPRRHRAGHHEGRLGRGPGLELQGSDDVLFPASAVGSIAYFGGCGSNSFTNATSFTGSSSAARATTS